MILGIYAHIQNLIVEGSRHTVDDQGSLNLRAIRNVDEGVYKCMVTSVGGNDEAEASITVIGQFIFQLFLGEFS